jgi:glucosyl-3-phosphoglycerate synthase
MTMFSDPSVAAWFARRTVSGPGPDLGEVMATKDGAGLTIGVCLPALDEAATVGRICEVIATDLVAPGFVDRLVVVDSGSTDETMAVAAAAGASVARARDLVPTAPEIATPGKGESLWKSLSVVDTDVIVWLDSDTRNFGSHFIVGLVAPLLSDPEVVFSKAFYERPLHGEDGLARTGGGRVTELAIRPLVNLFYPEFAGFIQPLSGEYAGRRDALIELPFGVGYEVDVLLLIDVVERFGLDAVAQVDLGRRVHRNRDADALGRMSFEIMRALFDRLERSGRLKVAGDLPDLITQFADLRGRYLPNASMHPQDTRPPMRSLPET